MNNTDLQKQISEHFSELPSAMQGVFSDMSWMDQVEDIGKKYNLSEEQIQSLLIDTSMIMLGVVHIDEYKTNLVQELKINEEQAKSIENDVNSILFNKIKPYLPELYNKKAENVATNKYGGLKNIDERFKSLPLGVQEAITKSDYKNNLYLISNKYRLNIPDMSALDEITTKVMLGIVNSSDFKTELSKNIQNKENIDMIVGEVDELVFKNIRTLMASNTKNVEVKEKIEIPIPPYKKPSIPAPPYKKSTPQVPNNLPILEFEKKETSDGMKNSGVEIIPEENKMGKIDEEKVTIKEDNIMVKSGISLVEEKRNPPESHIIPSKETQKSVLYGIENPLNTKSILNIKLQSSTSSNINKNQQNISNIPQASPDQTKTIIHDPYHEQI